MYCPNPECPYAKRFNRPAEYREGFQQCSDCGSALVAVAVVVPVQAQEPARAGPWQRLAVSAGALALAWGATRVELPGLRPRGYLPITFAESAQFTLARLGLNPAINAFIIVEWAALIVPAWRALRTGPPEERARLRRAAYALAAVLGLAEGLVASPRVASSLLLGPVLAVMSVLALALAEVVSRRGLGNGFSLLIAGAIGVDALEQLWVLGVFTSRHDIGSGELVATLVLFALVALASFLLFARSWPSGQAPRGLPLPASGVVPANLAAGLLALPLSLALLLKMDAGPYLELVRHKGWAYDAAYVALVAAGCAALSFLFNRPEKVEAVRARLGSTARWDPLVKGAVASFLFLAITYGAGRAAESVTPRLGVLEMLGVAVLVAVALDVQSEWRFRRRHGVVASIWPVHQVYAAPAVIEALA
ncbi:MAG TPA: hypothetical protein VND93_23915, partial [Myxococcales bacterium]|nr:hypothetical protein [Myxococcales bacterium]